MIEVRGLVFEYPGIRALDDVSFSIAPGSITALVGPNGAGKSTLLRCLAALDQPLAGQISISSVDVLEHPRSAHRNVGFLADFFGLYHELTVRQCLLYVARAHGISVQDENRAITRAAQRLQIDSRMNDKAGTLSRGLAQRLAIAQSIVHEPRVLLLDEPASGLDPEARESLAQLFLTLRDQGMTLLVSSHILAELEAYCSDMLILRQGRVVEHAMLQEHAGGMRMRLALCEPHQAVWELLMKEQGVSALEQHDGEYLFKLEGGKQQQYHLLRRLVESGVPVSAFAEHAVNLQDAYLRRVRRGEDGL